MENNEWLESLSEEDRTALEALTTDEEVAAYLGEHSIELPDEALMEVAGGVNVGREIGKWVRKLLGFK